MTDNGFDTGVAQGTPIVPVLLGGGGRAPLASAKLIEEGVNVSAIMAPAVPDGEERLRFFATSEHTTDQLAAGVEALARVVHAIGG
ncbi:hypothetical protein GFY24_11025 [Nocardia sp. SYP-A9097]|uniref:hypothetical protein n=1 Tax=Nocardia sp. SYP-A9097 TaxID=2663237 RepID=UPI00129B8060|nr:hypothetical protein [Nocardia sp. SYP-A9097]MRH87971.1 hypothetical protein [Nocardia sp. SYP-A9097]